MAENSPKHKVVTEMSNLRRCYLTDL